jgi:TatA/E family protein of Tat protein translocase
MAVATITALTFGIMGFPELAFLGGIGSTEVLMIMVVMLLLFGPKQLPELAKTIGKALRGIRKATDEMKEEIGLDELVSPRPRRPRNYRPRKNVPPSLQEGEGTPSTTRQVSEGEADEVQSSTLVPADALPAHQNQATVPPDTKPAEQSQVTDSPDRGNEPEASDQQASTAPPLPIAKDETAALPPKPTPKEDPES